MRKVYKSINLCARVRVVFARITRDADTDNLVINELKNVNKNNLIICYTGKQFNYLNVQV